MSVNDEDYSSYLTLMASLSGSSSDDKHFNQAIIVSLESHMRAANPQNLSLIIAFQKCQINIKLWL